MPDWKRAVQVLVAAFAMRRPSFLWPVLVAVVIVVGDVAGVGDVLSVVVAGAGVGVGDGDGAGVLVTFAVVAGIWCCGCCCYSGWCCWC